MKSSGIVSEIEALMLKARAQGLYRTTERLHTALNEARAEIFEVLPHFNVDFAIGPVREQPERGD
jgi:hypothetical protein